MFGRNQVDNTGGMLGPKIHPHVEAHLKLTLWKVEPFVRVMKETSKHDPISKTHSMLFLSGTWSLSRSMQCTYRDIKIFDILDIFI